MKPTTVTRRKFIVSAIAGAGMLALKPARTFASPPPNAPFWPKDAAKYRIYMIGHAHLDLVWLWPWTEGLAVVHSTFRSALERMKETPDLVFTASSALFYQWVAENDPAMLHEIRERVSEGRWNVVGGWWTEPDMNIPSGEAMARNGLYGQLAFRRLVGKQARIAFSADAFGHAGTLPQIIRLQGMEGYVFMRPGGGEKSLPANLFQWESADGSQVIAYRIHHHYGSLDQGEALTTRKDLGEVATYVPQHPAPMVMKFFGVGDHGGGPSKAHIQAIINARAEKGAPPITFSSVDSYFDDLKQQPNLKLPVVRDDLQHHAPGCYTADSAIKRNNRLAEAAIMAAEKLAAIGSIGWHAHYPIDEFTRAWQRIMVLQFHDSMAGTSLVSHYRYARDGYGYALNVAADTAALALQKLEWQIPATDPQCRYIVAFNPHAWPFRGVIRYEGDRNERVNFVDANGGLCPHQWITGEAQTHGRHTLLLHASIPPMGYMQIRGRVAETPAIDYPAAKAEGRTLENEYFRITFGENGCVGIYDKMSDRTVFAGSGTSGCRAVVLRDLSDTWSHDVKSFDDEIGEFAHAEIKPLHNGPLLATMRVTTTYNYSTLTIDWSLEAGSPRIMANVKLDWHERQQMLKFSFPLAAANPQPTCEAPYGYIVRTPNGDEDPGQRWMDVSDVRNGEVTYGLTVINDAKYGYSCRDADLRISIVRSPVYAHHQPKELRADAEYEWMDQGIQTFRMMLVPHSGSWQDNHIPRIAEEFMTPPAITYQGIHPGTMPASGSFMSVTPANIVVTAVKKAEEGDALIVRLVETEGRPVTANFHMPSIGVSTELRFRACEIKTLRIATGTQPTVREVNLLEE